MTGDGAKLDNGTMQQLLKDALGLAPDEQPFPWQMRLLNQLISGNRPQSIDIPTGLGKTAVMAIWLVALAQGAPLPRRLVYIVDRRAVVDQATDVAFHLRDWLETRPDIADCLGLLGCPLPISTLRGQYTDNKDWLEDPASPAIIVGTVDMIGSRLLFEGYVVSRKMRPYHAGLLGADAWTILDESHLVVPFERLLVSIQQSIFLKPKQTTAGYHVIPPFVMTALSATGTSNDGNAFSLGEDDMQDKMVRQRLNARKTVIVKRLREDDDLAKHLADQAWELAMKQPKGERILVYCDRRSDAEKAFAVIEAHRLKEQQIEVAPAELFVGARRVRERQQAWNWLHDSGYLASYPVVQGATTFLVATSAAEVGVDIDASHMVCDTVAWDRMIQRFGRVNRKGERDSRVVVFRTPDPEEPTKDGKAGSGSTIKHEEWAHRMAQLRLIDTMANKSDGFQAGPGALLSLAHRAKHDDNLGAQIRAATTNVPRYPALTRPLVDAWSMTSLPEHTGRPIIRPWLRGWIANDRPQTRVIWRRYLPVREGQQNRALVTPQEVEAFFEAAPPHLSEVLEADTWRVTKWLLARVHQCIRWATGPGPAGYDGIIDDYGAKQPSGSVLEDDDIIAYVLSPAGDLISSIAVSEIPATQSPREKRALAKQWGLPGGTLIVDARIAGLGNGLLDDGVDEPPPTADGPDSSEPWENQSHAMPQIRFRVVPDPSPTTARPLDNRWRERLRFAVRISAEGEPKATLSIQKWRADASTEEDRSFARPQLLDEHRSWAEERANLLAKRLHLPSNLAAVLRIAAFLHDEGKRSDRWQEAFNAPAGGPFAKTRGPINQRALDGYRHEFGSFLAAETNKDLALLPSDLRDLALHMICAHHGYSRPLISSKSCDLAPPTHLEPKVQEIALRFARLQKSWGPWGLAWWETLLRATDQKASRDNDERREING